MSKKKKRHPRKKVAAGAVAVEPTRRDVMRLARNGLIGTVAVGGVGWWAVSGVQAVAAEQDLSRVGQGKPAIVQIHDPQCALCTELQRQARKALKEIDDEDLLYLVASTRTDDGAAFANALGLSHVTLVLMNADGQVESVLEGVRQSDELKGHFQALSSKT
ncbi:hypothetical protein N9L47_08115 [Rhodobacteraceae bacterium]|nr:hypothetical protein [Paracoccaceae bacterium]